MPDTSGDETQDQQDATPNEDAQQEPEAKDDSEDLSIEDLRAERDKWKALSRRNEARAKENQTAAQEWAKHKDSLKTAEERATEQQKALEHERDSAQAELAVLRAAMKHGLSEDDLELLEGLPADVVEQRAEKLANRIPKTRKPAPDPHAGRETEPSGSTAGDFLRNAFRGH